MTAALRPLAKLSEDVAELKQQQVTFVKATVVAISPIDSTFTVEFADGERLAGITAPPHFLPAVGDEVLLERSGALPIYQPGRVAAGAIGEVELAPGVNENITIAMSAANGKNTFFFSPDAPTAGTPGKAVGDSWMRRDNVTRVITGTWEWDGDSWEPVTYGDEVLTSLTVGKLVGGTGTFDLIVGGRIATANTGQRTELNPLGLQGFNSAGTLTVNIDGVDNLLTGRVRTGLTGRRVEVGVTGSSGEIRFFAANGTTQSFLRSYTDTTSGQEGLQLGMPIAGAAATWNALYYNQQEWTSYQTKIHDFVYQDRWSVIQTTNRGAGGGKRRIYADANEFQLRGGFGTDETKSLVYDWTGGSLQGSFASGAKFKIGDGFAGQSPNILIHAADNWGVVLRATSTGTGAWFDVMNVFSNNYAGIRASQFEVNSDARGKSAIVAAPITDALAQVDTITPRRYRRAGSDARPVPNEDGEMVPVPDGSGDEEIGVLAQELPAFLVTGSTESEMSFSVVRWLLLLTAAVQQLNQRGVTT